jgi:regulatory protein
LLKLGFYKMKKPSISLKGRALRYLSLREHSRVELERKLRPHVQEGDDLEAILHFLESAKYLSESRFADSMVNRRQARFGNQRILNELQTHGMPEHEMERIRDSLQDSEMERALQVLHKKFPEVAQNYAESCKQMRFLQQRGFSSQIVSRVVRAQREEE